MPETYLALTEDEFDTRFPLVENRFNPNSSWAVGEGTGSLFETYGQELDFVRQQASRYVWTLIDGDDGNLYVVSGPHFVNRIGYLISQVPIPENTFIEVRLDSCDDQPEDSP